MTLAGGTLRGSGRGGSPRSGTGAALARGAHTWPDLSAGRRYDDAIASVGVRLKWIELRMAHLWMGVA